MTTATNTKSGKNRNKNLDKLIGPMDKAQDNKARDRLISSRVALLLKHSFFGNLATRMQLVNADEWCSTAATDGLRFYYNSRFINMLKPREVEFLFGHEILHVVYDHLGRRQDRDPVLSNIAADYAVNADLKRHKVGEFITTVPCLYESKYDGKSFEEIYDDLFDKAEKIDMDKLIDQLIDDHLEDQEDEPNNSGDNDRPGAGKRPKPMSAEERDRVKQEIKQNIINAARGSDAGSIPKGVERLIKDITEPKMPWRELLSTNIVSAIRDDYSFSRPNRRGWHSDAIMPGMTPGQEIELVVAIDTSGSIGTKQLKDFLGEIQGIMDSFNAFKIHVLSFDTEVYNTVDYTSENMDSIADYEPKGGGGTDFDCFFNYLKERGTDVKRLVVFTDGYPFGSWGDDNFCDTTWIIHGNVEKNITPPFGTWAYYE